MAAFIPTPYQQRLLGAPEDMNLFLGGGRGGGKTSGSHQIVLRHVELYGDKASVLIIRETLASLREVEESVDGLLRNAYGSAVKSDRQEHQWRLPNGGTVECGYLDAVSDLHRYQGRTFSLIIVEEVGTFRNLRLVDQLRACLRAPGVPNGGRMILLANPGGRCHSLLHKRYIAGRRPWTPFVAEDGSWWCYAPSTLLDNPHLPDNYRDTLLAACGHDQELFRAWCEGSWDILRGAFFADVIDPSRQMFTDPGFEPSRQRGSDGAWLACDWGISAPAVGLLCVRALAPLGRFPRGSLLLLDEVHSCEPDDYSVGQGWSPTKFGDELLEMLNRWGVRSRHGVIDDSQGLGVSLIETLRAPPIGLYLEKPVKGRRDGWALMRELLFNSKEGNQRAGLYISERCRGWWATVPEVPRDPLKPEDLDTKAVDHFCDATRYAATNQPRFITQRGSTGY